MIIVIFFLYDYNAKLHVEQDTNDSMLVIFLVSYLYISMANVNNIVSSF